MANNYFNYVSMVNHSNGYGLLSEPVVSDGNLVMFNAREVRLSDTASQLNTDVADNNSIEHFRCTVGSARCCYPTFELLLMEPTLLNRFLDEVDKYCSDFDFQLSQNALNTLIQSREEFRGLFLRINAIETVPGSINSGNLTEVVPLGQRSASTASAPIIYNTWMKRCDVRFFSITQWNFSNSHTSSFHPRVIFGNAFELSRAGFYFSLSEDKVACYSCGGVLEARLCAHFTSIQELHATVYPACSLLTPDSGFCVADPLLVAQPVSSHQNLYHLPITEGQRQLEVSMREAATLEEREGRGRSLQCLQNNGDNEVDESLITISSGLCVQQGGLDQVVNTCMAKIRKRLSSAQYQAVCKLQGKIRDTLTARETMTRDFLKILQDMVDLPWKSNIYEIIAATINTAEDGDCQDHTSEIVDQIKTRLAFGNVVDSIGILDGSNQIQWLEFLCKLKLFFNDEALYRVLSETRVHGKSLIESGESTEIRGFLKNKFARTICKFPVNQIVQYYASFGRPSDEYMPKIEKTFRQFINNQADFENYLTGLFKTDTIFWDFIKTHDNDFSVCLAKTESNSEILMEEYSQNEAGCSSQDVRVATESVVAVRQQHFNSDIEMFISEKVKSNWINIISQTSQQ